MQYFYKFLFSIKTSIFLLLIYIVLIALATFVENDFGTSAAQWLVYHNRWFNFLHFILMVNFFGIAFKYKLFQRKKLSILIFHFAFVIIIIGAAITRFMSYEGSMHLRSQETSNKIISENTFLNLTIDNNDIQYDISYPVSLNALSKPDFKKTLHFEDRDIDIEIVNFIPNSDEELIQVDSGETVLALVISTKEGAQNILLKSGIGEIFGNQFLSFNLFSRANGIHFFETDSDIVFTNPYPTWYSNMQDSTLGSYEMMKDIPFVKNRIYSWGKYKMALNKVYKNAAIRLVSQKDKRQYPLNALQVKINDGNFSKTINLFGDKGILPSKTNFSLNNLNYSMGYGSKEIPLPFSLKLNEFKLRRYPGSQNPASYESWITLNDSLNNYKEKYHIFMNNVLSYKGYRFYQASYDPDEQGSILSVNKDNLGTIISYIGYFFLILGMFFNLFDKNGRFRKLYKKIKEMNQSGVKSIILIFFFLSIPYLSHSQDNIPDIDKNHAAKFGRLVVQDPSGRMTPVNTLSNKIIRKLLHKTKYKNMNSDQALLSMLVAPSAWLDEAVIKVKDPDIIKRFNVKDKHISINNLLQDENKKLMQNSISQAYKTAPGKQSLWDRDIIKLNEKINVLHMALQGDFLNIFPLAKDKKNKWYNINTAINKLSNRDSAVIYDLYKNYILSVQAAIKTKNWKAADESLLKIKEYQEKEGSNIMPPKKKINAEILYNKVPVFKYLFELYFLIGWVYLILLFLQVLFSKLRIKYLVYSFTSILILSFLIQTAGLILRWYIAGHAPWSNGYESMLYIAWATQLAGLIFSRQSNISLAATTVLSGLMLWVGQLSWMDPEITNLVPVLQSYWLTIHVAVITSSYGFLALGAILAFINLFLMLFLSKKNKNTVQFSITKITYIVEMTLIAGLFLLSIGTFIGGVWANESWGRYWGWDSKETWSLITMLVYAVVLHLRFIPKLKSEWFFNVVALFAYSSVLMTYWGVNYYLSGLHSYAKGDPIPIPSSVYYTLGFLLMLSLLAYARKETIKGKNL